MFRDKNKAGMNAKNFGVGSLIIGGSRNRYMVIGASTSGPVGLLDLNTMTLVGGWVDVEDVNLLSENEARELVHQNDIGYAFSDFTLNAHGLKYGNNIEKEAFKY